MILDEIAAKTRERIQEEKKRLSPDVLREQAEKLPVTGEFPFEKALRQPGIRFICEVKKASPSKGVIAEHFPYREIAREYEEAGAAAVSVLTEPFYFQGKDEYLREIRQDLSIPILRKDFVVDDYMIYQAKVLGADAVLLICAILTEEELARMGRLAESLGLSALVEAHDEEEAAMALRAGARIIGVNNRNLKNFQVNVDNALNLRSKIPEEVLFVAESGIKTREDVRKLEDAGCNGILIGETLMRSPSKKEMLARLKGEL